MKHQITVTPDEHYGYLYARGEFGVGVRLYDRFNRPVGRIICWEGEVDPNVPPELVRWLRQPDYTDRMVAHMEAAPITHLQWWRRVICKFGLAWGLGCVLGTVVHGDFALLPWFSAAVVVHAVGLTYEWMVVDRIRPRAESD